MSRRRSLALMASLALLLLLTLAPLTLAQVAQSDTYGDRDDGQHIADRAQLFDRETQTQVNDELIAVEDDTDIDIVVYTQEKAEVGNRRNARQEAAALLDEWDVGGNTGLGAVWLVNVNEDRSAARSGLALSQAWTAGELAQIDDVMHSTTRSTLAAGAFADALQIARIELEDQLVAQGTPTVTPSPRPPISGGGTSTVTGGSRPTDALEPPAGPPYPDPLPTVSVYDYAKVISPDVITRLDRSIDAIEERTGAEVVIYTQYKASADSPAATEADAIALIDQWGVGREGFDDGLAIFFNLKDECHGQVQLYAAPGYRAAYLTNDERQAVFEEQMVPFLRECDFDAALLSAMRVIDGAATAEHARNLQLARQIDAMAGLVVAPLLLIGLVGWAGWSWLRFGRDPEYLDDDSILMPAPPPGLSPAAAAVIIDGRSRRHALTTAMVDLASRGEISFRSKVGAPGELSIDITVPDQRDARLARNRRRELGDAEAYALKQLKGLGGAIRTIDPEDVPKFASSVSEFDERLEETVAANGWFAESPGDAVDRWSRRAALVLIAGVVGLFAGISLPSSGLVLVAVAAIAAAIAIFVIARAMPQRTMEGARMYAQLAAYRRTLQRTLESSRTMDQVVASKALPWVETPDQAVVWAYALGLHEEAEEVLERSLEDVRTGAASPTRTYFPLWFAIGARDGGRIGGGIGRAATAGLFSEGVVPDFTSMTAALSTIGSSPSSAGGGGGGFSGGSSGGGGGGAGGGF
ncbi:MAG: TPM domain-containing protein [Candidatus Limnocylindrales bacterium]